MKRQEFEKKVASLLKEHEAFLNRVNEKAA